LRESSHQTSAAKISRCFARSPERHILKRRDRRELPQRSAETPRSHSHSCADSKAKLPRKLALLSVLCGISLRPLRFRIFLSFPESPPSSRAK
jgi:hypothetical protein